MPPTSTGPPACCASCSSLASAARLRVTRPTTTPASSEAPRNANGLLLGGARHLAGLLLGGARHLTGPGTLLAAIGRHGCHEVVLEDRVGRLGVGGIGVAGAGRAGGLVARLVPAREVRSLVRGQAP